MFLSWLHQLDVRAFSMTHSPAVWFFFFPPVSYGTLRCGVFSLGFVCLVLVLCLPNCLRLVRYCRWLAASVMNHSSSHPSPQSRRQFLAFQSKRLLRKGTAISNALAALARLHTPQPEPSPVHSPTIHRHTLPPSSGSLGPSEQVMTARARVQHLRIELGNCCTSGRTFQRTAYSLSLRPQPIASKKQARSLSQR